uniref:Nucleolar protein 56 n=1 Tax=Schistosoma haematobium TaxID=6185 RepID=A0A095A136_SCHHA
MELGVPDFFQRKFAKVYILYEHALGYALFRVKVKSLETSDAVAALQQLAADLLNDEEEFMKCFKLHAFVPFSSSASALQNCNGISEGVVPQELKTFIEENLPASDVLLCISDRKLAESLKAPEVGLPETIACSSESILHEVFRALRFYFPKYIKEFSHFDESKAQIGLGHSYSRAKVKFNIYRNDNMIIQSINLLDQLDKDVNNFCMRVKEWFSYHFPELSKIVPDNPTFVKVIGLIRTRAGATEENLEALEALTNSQVASDIIESAKSSVGFDITDDDAENLATFTEKINALIERRRLTQEYLAKKLAGVAPNLSTMIGDRVSARLIAHAGSLTNLAKFPASTIQILGAEKALFRALRTRGATPKYGLIYHSQFITRAARENKGKISRFLAAKCAIASRIDCFSEVLCDIYGKHLKQQIEDRLNYFETGTTPPTNAEAMARAIAEVNKYIQRMKKKAIKTLNKRDSDSQEEKEAAVTTLETPILDSKKKRKKKRNLINGNITTTTVVDGVSNDQNEIVNHDEGELDQQQQQQQQQTTEMNQYQLLNDNKGEKSTTMKKKKKRHHSESIDLVENSMLTNGDHICVETIETSILSKRKRSASESSILLEDIKSDSLKKKKRKKTSYMM